MNELTTILICMVSAGTPIIYALLGDLIGQRTGITSLSVEGSMLCGACVGFAVAAGSGSLFLAVLCAAIAGGLIGLIQAFLSISRKSNDGDRVYPDFLCAGPDHLFWKITARRQPWKVVFPRHSGSEQDSGDWAGLFSAGYSDVYRLCTSGVGLVVPDKNKNGAGALFCGGTA